MDENVRISLDSIVESLKNIKHSDETSLKSEKFDDDNKVTTTGDRYSLLIKTSTSLSELGRVLAKLTVHDTKDNRVLFNKYYNDAMENIGKVLEEYNLEITE